MKNLMICLFLSTLSFQLLAVELKGFDNKGRRCSLEVFELDSKNGEVRTNYSDSEFSVTHSVGEVGMILRGQISEEDSYEGEFVTVKLDDDLKPIEFTYYNNIGLIRFIKPFSRVCKIF